MTSIRFVVPEATQNLVTNPSIEAATTGYTAVSGAALARVTTDSRRGTSCLRVTPTAATGDGEYYAITLSNAGQYTYSIDLKGVVGVPYQIYIYDVTAAVILGTPTNFTGDGKWHRYEVTVTRGANTSHRLYCIKNNDASTGAFFVDGVQCEQKSYSTTYCDGTQPGCTWDGTANASTSSRLDTTRLGGRPVDPETYGMAIEALGGFGTPPLTHNALSYSQLPGAYLDSIKVEPRTLELGITVNTETEANLYNARRQLEQVLSQARLATKQPILMQYVRQTREVDIPVYYDSGLEGRWDQFWEKLLLRLIAYDPPYWRETSEAAIALTMSQSTVSARTLRVVNGVPNNSFGSVNGGDVLCVAKMNDGTWVIGGAFTDIGGDANMARIAKFDPGTGVFSALGTGGANGNVRAVTVSPSSGLVYATGAFTTIGGVAANRCASWNGAAWAALGTGFNVDGGLAVDMDVDGVSPIFTGSFATGNGVTLNGIGKWNGSTFVAYGSGVTSGTVDVRGIVVNRDGSFYVGGQFTAMNAVANTEKTAKWTGSAWVALTATTGADDNVYKLWRGNDYRIYFGGAFTTIGGVSATNLARFNGSYFEAIGSNLVDGPSINGLAWDATYLWVAGHSTLFNNWPNVQDFLARWDGSVFRNAFFDITSGSANSCLVAPDGSMLISTSALTSTLPASTTFTYEGDVIAYPVITISRTGGATCQLYGIRNLSTGAELLFNLTIYAGETITIDLSQASKPISSNLRGTNFTGYLQGSNLSSFGLKPGSNTIQIMMVNTGAPTVTGSMRWRNVFEAVDGALA